MSKPGQGASMSASVWARWLAKREAGERGQVRGSHAGKLRRWLGRRARGQGRSADRSKMSSFTGYQFLATKTKNLIVAGGLTGFVFGVYYYTMRAVGGTDELQVAIDKFEELKKN
ncbi:hypothetical protein M5K25_007893 [Dendrobium thyrsiflorum]|uniref:Cytochrome c oxidase assembly factor 3 mitochondrial coiled-coil domain-containing protein n=1 Tax=Dendrobium thyrsiflorum TaxID=117978 RepID=A0ABD0VEJ5_DENTH